MSEIFPVLAGLLGGVLVVRLPRRRLTAWLVISLTIGVIASFVSGEIDDSVGFIAIDFLEAAIAGALVWGLLRLTGETRQDSASG